MINFRFKRNKKTIPVALTLAFCAAAAGAATFTVSDSVDTGVNTLRQAITDSNAAGGTNTISWAATGGFPIPLLSDLPEIGSNTTLDVSAATAPVSITANPGSMGISSATVFQNGGAQLWTIAAAINGVGSLKKTGAGELFLSASNNYSGGTSIDAGTLRVNSDASLGSGGALTFNGGTLRTHGNLNSSRSLVINAGGGTIDTAGFDSLFAGVLSGPGALTKTSTGTLTLTGVNTFSGGFNVNGGTVAFNADAALGAGTVTLANATLQTTVAMLFSKNIALGGAGAIDTAGRHSIYSGVISGANALTKTGEGTLTLTGANTYTGGTTVHQGTLALGVNGALAAAGALTVESGAAFSLNTYTQTVNALTAPGTIKMKLSGTSLTVTNNANFTGGTLEVEIAPQAVTAGQVFTPITYGSNTGCYTTGTIVSPAALSFTPACGAGSLTLTAALVPFADTAGSGNQADIGRALEPLRTAPSGDAATVLGELYTLDAPSLRAALDRIGPASLSSLAGIAQSGAGIQSAAIGRRMGVLAARAQERPSYHTVSGPSPFRGTLLAARGGSMGALDEDFDRSGSPWGFFASLLGGGGQLGESHGPSGTSPGYAFRSAGLVAGADYRLNDLYTAGASLGYLKGHASLRAPSAGTVDSSSLRYGVYGSRDDGPLHAGLYLGGASSFITARRVVAFGGLSRTATGNPSGLDFDAEASARYDYKSARRGTYSPFAALAYNRSRIGSFSETGAGALNLSVDAQTIQSMQSTLGTRLSHKIQNERSSFAPYVSLAWRHELRSQSRSIRANFANGTGSSFSVATGDFARDGTVVGAGFETRFGRSITTLLDYSGDFRSHYQNTSVNASFRLHF